MYLILYIHDFIIVMVKHDTTCLPWLIRCRPRERAMLARIQVFNVSEPSFSTKFHNRGRKIPHKGHGCSLETNGTGCAKMFFLNMCG